MNKERLNELLDSIYELEGLVHLAITRDDSPAMLPELIRRKSREMVVRAESATAPESILKPEPEPEPVSRFEQVQVSDPEPRYKPEPESEPEPESALEPEPELKFEEEFRKQQVIIEPEERTEEKPVEKPEESPIKEAEQKPIVKETYAFEEYTEPKGRLVFSINDRYRFKRELFRGSDVDFNTTLSLVASMEGYDEAEDYFLNELQWDEKSPDVIDFLEILKNYFK